MARKDPEGRMQARQRAAAAEEALALLAVAHKRIQDVGRDDLSASIEALCRDVRRAHTEEAQRGRGFLEGRNKYKGRSQHLAIERERRALTLYVDESGQAQIQPDQPVFVLAGVAMSEEDASGYRYASDNLKARFGLGLNVTLHGPKIEKGLEDFAFGGDGQLQAEFCTAVEELVQESRFHLIAAVVRKDVLVEDVSGGADYRNLPTGLYEMALTFVAERFVDYLYREPSRLVGEIMFESIGNREDAKHQRAFADLLIHGSEFVSDGCFRGWLRPGCTFRIKEGSHPLELADLAARALHMWMKAGMPKNHAFWRLWAHRIPGSGDLQQGKFGVKIFPDADIREQVLSFRTLAAERRSEA